MHILTSCSYGVFVVFMDFLFVTHRAEDCSRSFCFFSCEGVGRLSRFGPIMIPITLSSRFKSRAHGSKVIMSVDFEWLAS